MTELLNYLIVSYNICFTAPLTIVFILALIRLFFGGIDFGDSDIDVEGDGESSSFSSVFGFLNVGRVPLLIVLMSLFTT